MKRTAEITLSIIGGALSLLALISGIRISSIDTNALRVQLMASATNSNQNITSSDIDNVIQLVHILGTTLIVISAISIVLAIAALVLLFLRKKPVLSGVLLIVAGVVSLPALFPGILYLIAGIINLVRKPRKQLE